MLHLFPNFAFIHVNEQSNRMKNESFGERMVASVVDFIGNLMASIWEGLPWYGALISYIALLVGLIIFVIYVYDKLDYAKASAPLMLPIFSGILGGLISFFTVFLNGYGLSSLGRFVPVENDFGNILFVVATYMGILLILFFVGSLFRKKSVWNILIILVCTLILTTISFIVGLLLSFILIVGGVILLILYLPRFIADAAPRNFGGGGGSSKRVDVRYGDGTTSTARQTGKGILGEKYYEDEHSGRTFTDY